MKSLWQTNNKEIKVKQKVNKKLKISSTISIIILMAGSPYGKSFSFNIEFFIYLKLKLLGEFEHVKFGSKFLGLLFYVKGSV